MTVACPLDWNRVSDVHKVRIEIVRVRICYDHWCWNDYCTMDVVFTVGNGKKHLCNCYVDNGVTGFYREDGKELLLNEVMEGMEVICYCTYKKMNREDAQVVLLEDGQVMSDSVIVSRERLKELLLD